jgi:methionine sulfoxide reductase catalytic subunit
MRHTKSMQVRPSEITSESVYLRRRECLRMLGLGAVALVAGCDSDAAPEAASDPPAQQIPGKPLTVAKRTDYTAGSALTRYKDVTHYNNYYEFGTDKGQPAQTSGRFRAHPWTVEVAGHAEVTGRFALEDFLGPNAIEERVYRMRCVEGWSMVIPWDGVPLGAVLKRFKPTAAAKYVAFTSVYRPEEMPGIRILDWPYREGLRIDEAMHPLALLAVGLYGHELPNQNGAPLRLVVPWKYGFKGIKSIARIEFVESEPKTAWNEADSDEYGFYSNVNPSVGHPRWSQRTERRIAGDGFNLFGNRIATLPFNGYADQVASLYAGMDLRRNF